MNVKEIRELEDEIREVGSAEKIEKNEGSWEEKDVFVEDADEDLEEDKKEKFSIGDTMLARGEAVENWGGGGLEEELEGEEFERSFGEEDFEEEEFGGEDFSYETMGQSGSGDLYGAGAGSSGGDLYGAGSSSGSDLYGAGGSGSGMDLYGAPGQKGSDSVNLYATSGNSGGEISMYNVAGPWGKKNSMGSVYQVEGGRQKKFREGGERKRSELEGHVARAGRPTRAQKGVSLL